MLRYVDLVQAPSANNYFISINPSIPYEKYSKSRGSMFFEQIKSSLYSLSGRFASYPGLQERIDIFVDHLMSMPFFLLALFVSYYFSRKLCSY